MNITSNIEKHGPEFARINAGHASISATIRYSHLDIDDYQKLGYFEEGNKKKFLKKNNS